MPAESLTKAQVQAYRYGMRRLETAVASGQPYRRSLGGPRHSLSLIIGFILATLVVAGFAVYGFIKPAPSVGNATVLIDSDHGGAYVLRGGRLHPALNLASALLAAGNRRTGDAGSAQGAPVSRAVSADTLGRMPKGQMLGISGAPTRIPANGALVPGTWTACDTSTQDPAQAPSRPPAIVTTAVLGQPVPDTARTSQAGVLVTPDGGHTTYLLWGSRRSPVTLSDHAAVLALGLEDVTPRPISLGLLNAIPQGPALVSPTVPNAGASSDWNPAVTVGTVFRVQFARGTTDFVALRTGVQRLTPVLSDVLRASDPAGGTTIPRLRLSALNGVPVLHDLPVDDFPALRPAYFTVAQAPDVCLSWSGGSAGGAATGTYAVYPATAVPLPAGGRPVPAPPKSAPGSADQVFIAPGHGAVFGQVTGDQKAPTGALFLVTDQGVKYPVVDSAALASLGLGRTIYPAAPELLNLLPTGPTLDPAAASRYVDAAAGAG